MGDNTLWLIIEGDELWHNTKVYDPETGKILPISRVEIVSGEGEGFITAKITCLVREVHFKATGTAYGGDSRQKDGG